MPSKVLMIVAIGVPALAIIGWLGLQIRPVNLSMPTHKPEASDKVTIPNDLPPIVARYYQVSLGKDLSRINTMVVRGRARAKFGLWMPIRYRLTHKPGYEFERYMEVTWFGIPILKAVDRFVDGRGMTGPVGREAKGPEVDQGANLILWAEGPLMPSLWLTDPRIRWEEIDGIAARLIFPFGDEEDELTVYFNAETGLISRIFAMRYRDEKSGKVPWFVDFLEWQNVDGMMLPSRISITWGDQRKPWSYWTMEDYLWNVETSGILMPETAAESFHFRGRRLEAEHSVN